MFTKRPPLSGQAPTLRVPHTPGVDVPGVAAVLDAPRSAIVQPSPVHGGITADPAAELDRLMRRYVR
ncbi:DUF3037 domain-containing protein [Streptomyces sp. NPDC088246]|uniref:DUF3037 domain-containing protein n=1 Tax=Streptomyces sp. NPDC088246 TaxID=3365842 RepID=UPI00380E87E3